MCTTSAHSTWLFHSFIYNWRCTVSKGSRLVPLCFSCIFTTAIECEPMACIVGLHISNTTQVLSSFISFRSRRTVLMLSYLLVPLSSFLCLAHSKDDYLSEMVLVYLIRDGLISSKEWSGTQLYKWVYQGYSNISCTLYHSDLYKEVVVFPMSQHEDMLLSSYREIISCCSMHQYAHWFWGVFCCIIACSWFYFDWTRSS